MPPTSCRIASAAGIAAPRWRRAEFDNTSTMSGYTRTGAPPEPSETTVHMEDLAVHPGGAARRGSRPGEPRCRPARRVDRADAWLREASSIASLPSSGCQWRPHQARRDGIGPHPAPGVDRRRPNHALEARLGRRHGRVVRHPVEAARTQATAVDYDRTPMISGAARRPGGSAGPARHPVIRADG